jgi:hypothetical protein
MNSFRKSFETIHECGKTNEKIRNRELPKTVHSSTGHMDTYSRTRLHPNRKNPDRLIPKVRKVGGTNGTVRAVLLRNFSSG